MRLRFFNTFEPVAPLFRDLLPFLHDGGHSVEVVVSKGRYRGGERRDLNGVSFTQLPGPPALPGQPALWKALSHGSYALEAAAYATLSRGVDLNVFMTQPPLFSTWGRVLRRVRRQPYACIVMDLYPWVAFEAGMVPADSAASRMAERLAADALKGARAVIVIGRCMAERIEALGVPRSRIHVICNWANTDVIEPVAKTQNALRKELGLKSKFVVMYSGNLGVSHEFDGILGAARRLADEDITFLFVGRGARRAEVERAALPNVRVLDYQPYERLAESLSLGDVHFVSLRDGFEGLVVPSKAYGAWAAARPIIYQGRATGEVAQTITDHDIGTVVPQGDVDALAGAITRARDDRKWRTAAGKRARALVTGELGLENARRRYESVLMRTV